MSSTRRSAKKLMHIATISDLDGWIPTQCKRFVTSCRRYMPRCILHLVAPAPTPKQAAKAGQYHVQAQQLFDTVKVVKRTEVPGRLAYYDRLRTALPLLCNVPGVLYMDPDTDVMADLSEIPELVGAAAMGWVRNPLGMGFVKEYQEKIGVDTDSCIEEGMIYVNANLATLWDEIYARPEVDKTCFAPGMLVWDTLRRQVTSVQLDDTYNVTRVAPERFLTTKTLHYTGPFKAWRGYLRWSDNPRNIWFADKPLWDISKMEESPWPDQRSQSTAT